MCPASGSECPLRSTHPPGSIVGSWPIPPGGSLSPVALRLLCSPQRYTNLNEVGRTVPSMIVPRIEQLADRPDLLPIVAGWLYGEWWASVADETVESLAGRLGAHLIRDRIPLTLVASLNGDPVGTATLLAHDVGTEEWPELSPWLAALYVAPAFRRRGIGAALVNAAVAKAKTLGVEALYLFTIGQEGFYARLGGDVVHKRAEEVVMSKPTGMRAQYMAGLRQSSP
jgi:predicted N-acetyltransferase YhbS